MYINKSVVEALIKVVSKQVCVFVAGALALAVSAVAQAQDIEEIEVWGTCISSTFLLPGEDQVAQKQAYHLSDLLRGTR